MYEFDSLLNGPTPAAKSIPLYYTKPLDWIDLFTDTAAILISIVSKDIMGCSGGKLMCICPLGIP